MNAISHRGRAIVFAGILWTASTGGMGPGQAQPSAQPDASTSRVSEARLAGMEKQMWEMINRDRQDPANSAETGGRAQPLRWNGKLAAVRRPRAHSRNMAENGYFSHTDPDGTTFSARIIATGIRWQSMAENIASYRTVIAAEAGLMREPRFQPNHRGQHLERECH